MLEAGEEPIEAIAHEVGYEDAAFFSRCRAGRTNAAEAEHEALLAALVRLAFEQPRAACSSAR
jgi:transcriptional regulator GlxA family with amidase domain